MSSKCVSVKRERESEECIERANVGICNKILTFNRLRVLKRNIFTFYCFVLLGLSDVVEARRG